MKHKKTVTDAVRDANQANAKSSTGPRTKHGKSHSRQNAFRHGILARKIVLETHEERAEFRKLFQRCKNHFRPKGLWETFLVEEVATLFWKLRITLGLETKELSLRQQDSQNGINGVFRGDLDLPIEAADLPVGEGWDCERIVVRAVGGRDVANSDASRHPMLFQGQILKDTQQSQNRNTQNASHLEVEAILGSPLPGLTRYQSAIKRDLYRAIDKLRSVQSERRERDEV